MANSYADNEIGLINMCLLSIGDSALPTTLNPSTLTEGTDAAIARDIIAKVSRQVQKRGWWFNMDYSATMYRDENGEIIIDRDTIIRLNFASSYSSNNYTLRSGGTPQVTKVYDLFKHSTLLESDIVVDVVYNVSYEDLPSACYDYIGSRAANKFQKQVLGAVDLSANNMEEEVQALHDLEREQLQYINRNLMSPRVTFRSVNPTRGWKGA